MIFNGRAQGLEAPNGKPWNIYMVQGDDFVADIVTAQGMPTLFSSWATGKIACPNACGEVPVCFPGRAATLTGKRAKWSGVFNNGDGASYEATAMAHTIFSALERKGYTNAFIGKGFNGLGKPSGWGDLPFVHPGVHYQAIQWGAIDYFNWEELGTNGTIRASHGVTDTNTTGTDYAIDVERLRILEFLDTVPVGRPWFVYHSTKGCHQGDTGAPLPPSRYAAESVTITEDASFGLSVAQSGCGTWLLDEQESPWDAAAITAVRAEHTEALRVARALDEAFDAVMTEITARGEINNTIVIIKCDNTIASGEHRLTGKGTPHRSGQGMQLHVWVPGLSGGTCYAPISDIDIAPFLCHVTGASMDVASDGMSFLPALQDLSLTWRDASLHRSYGGSTPFSALRFGTASPVVYYEVDAWDELTEVQVGSWSDAAESTNVAAPAGAAAKLALLRDQVEV